MTKPPHQNIPPRTKNDGRLVTPIIEGNRFGFPYFCRILILFMQLIPPVPFCMEIVWCQRSICNRDGLFPKVCICNLDKYVESFDCTLHIWIAQQALFHIFYIVYLASFLSSWYYLVYVTSQKCCSNPCTDRDSHENT